LSGSADVINVTVKTELEASAAAAATAAAAGSASTTNKAEADASPVRASVPAPSSTALTSTPNPLLFHRDYWPAKDELIRYEQIVLRVLNFDLEVIHPHNWVLHFVRRLNGMQSLSCVRTRTHICA
jgi:hypothetical protein